MADLDRAAGRIDAHEARDTDRLASRIADDGEEQRVCGGAELIHPTEIGLRRIKRAIGQVGPVPSLGVQRVGRVQVCGVPRGIERLQAAKSPGHHLAQRACNRLPV